jgi:hypothetical protein
MRKLTFALPAFQLAVAMVLLRLGHRAVGPSGLDTLYVPTVTLVCLGINAPALFLGLVPRLFPETASGGTFGFSPWELLFLLGVVVLWYLVGRLLNNRKAAIGSRPAKKTTGGLLFTILVLALGLMIFYSGEELIRVRPWNNPVGTVVAGILCLLWAVGLVLLSGLRLAGGLPSPGAK